MIRTTVVGSWPPAERFAEPLGRYHRGELPPEEAEPLLREVASVAIAQQRECGLDEYTGGETSADCFILHFPKWLSGIEPTEHRDAWDGRGTYRVVGPIRALRGLGLAEAFGRERELDPSITKVTIPGPSEITMMLEPAEVRASLWPTITGLIREEIQAFIAAGATDVQLDAPHVAMGLVDNKWETAQAVDVIAGVFEGFEGIRRSLHLCYGDFHARSWTRNRSFHPLLPAIQALDGIIDRLVLELSLPEQWAERALLREVPESMEIAAGIVDVKTPQVETAEELRAKIFELLQHVPASRLLICPSCGLGRRNPELALAKVKAMIGAARSVSTPS